MKTGGIGSGFSRMVAGLFAPGRKAKPLSPDATTWRGSLTQEGTYYRIRLEALMEAIHEIYGLRTSEFDRQRALINGVVRVLGYGGVRGYQVDLEARTWFEFLTHGEMAAVSQHPLMRKLPPVSRFAEGAGVPGDREEKSFLVKLMRGEVRGEEAERLYRWHVNDSWALFYIPDRGKCAFIDPQRVAKDEKHYGQGRTAEIMFLVLGKIPQQRVVEVYQITNWTNDQPLFLNWEEDFKLLGTLAKALAVAEENRELHKRVEELAVTDPLTKLRNRRYFEEKFRNDLELAFRLGYPLSLLMIDIDHFKRFNDAYGHPFGDFVLGRVAQAIKEQLRQIDTAARYGGEEIAVLLPGGGNPAAIAERIRQAIERLRIRREGGEEVGVTISIGVATADPAFAHELSRDLGRGVKVQDLELVKRADHALYQAKNAGRNRVIVI